MSRVKSTRRFIRFSTSDFDFVEQIAGPLRRKFRGSLFAKLHSAKGVQGDSMGDWKSNVIEDTRGIQDIIRDTKTIAVLGIKPESHADQPAHYVPAHMAAAGYDIIPVPVYYPEVTEILGRKVFRKLTAIGRSIDMVNVFRRPKDIPQHVDEIIAAKPK